MFVVAATLAVTLVATMHLVAQPKPAAKIDLVTVTGCLTPGGGETWRLTSATDPIVASQKAPEPPKDAVIGKNRYRLIGLLEFNVAAHKGHTVRVKGLLIPVDDGKRPSPGSGRGEPVEPRLNITSLQHVAPTCPPPAKPQE